MIPKIYAFIPGWEPIDDLADAVVDGIQWMTTTIEKVIINPKADLTKSQSVRIFQDAQDNLAAYLVGALFGLVFIVAVFTMNKGKRLGYAFVVWIVTLAFLPIWSETVAYLRIGGLEAADTISKFEVQSDSEGIKGIGPAFIVILMGLFVLFGGMVLATLLTSYELLIVFFQLWFLVAFAVSMIGPRSRKLANIILAVGLVATLFGRPGAVFFLEAGQWAIETLPLGGTAFGAAVYTLVSYGAAALFQIVLFIVCYHGVIAVQGRVAAMVSGTVSSFIKNYVKVDIRQRAKQRQQQPMPVTVVTRDRTVNERVVRETKRVKRKAAVKLFEVGAGYVAGPQGYAAAKAAGKRINKD